LRDFKVSTRYPLQMIWLDGGGRNRGVSLIAPPPALVEAIEHLSHRALSVLNTGASPADAAARAGYCDQAHFTREATSLLGEPPAAWRNRRCAFIQDTARPADAW
jgi:hypothetical protein